MPIGPRQSEFEDLDDLMVHAEVGATQITMRREPALQSRDVRETWEPTDDTIAFVCGSLGDAQLLSAAAQISTVSSASLPQN